MKHFRRILYVAEPSVVQENAIARALSLAENNQAELTIVDVLPRGTAALRLPPGGPGPEAFQAEAVARRRAELEALLAPFEAREGVRIEVLIGQMFIEVIRRVLRDGYDLVIKPAENPRYVARLFGSEDMHLLRKCPCPVWLTRAGEKADYASIVAAVDFDPEKPEEVVECELNRQIMELASSLALSDFATLHLVHAWDAPAEISVRSWADNPDVAGMAYVEGERTRHRLALDGLGNQLRSLLGAEAYGHLSPQYHLPRGAAGEVIPATAQRLQADLVVMGTVARTGIVGLLIGNTAETILEQLQCSVLAIKPPGFVSPVTLAD